MLGVRDLTGEGYDSSTPDKKPVSPFIFIVRSLLFRFYSLLTKVQIFVSESILKVAFRAVDYQTGRKKNVFKIFSLPLFPLCRLFQRAVRI